MFSKMNSIFFQIFVMLSLQFIQINSVNITSSTIPTTTTSTATISTTEATMTKNRLLLSPAKAIKMNRYRHASKTNHNNNRLQVPINLRKHSFKFGFDELNLTSIDHQQLPQIEVPTTNIRDRIPLSLVFRTSSTPIALSSQNVGTPYGAQPYGSTSLVVETEPFQKTVKHLSDYQLIDPRLPKTSFPTTKTNTYEEVLPILLVPEVMPLAFDQVQPKMVKDNNNHITRTNIKPNTGETLKAIETMINSQDLSSILYEPLLLASLTDHIISKPPSPSSMTSLSNKPNNDIFDFAKYSSPSSMVDDTNGGKTIWTTSETTIPFINDGYQTFENLRPFSQFKAQDFLIPSTTATATTTTTTSSIPISLPWSAAISLQNHPKLLQLNNNNQFNNHLKQQQQQQQVEIAIFDMPIKQ